MSDTHQWNAATIAAAQKDCIPLLCEFEGCRLTAYQCPAGKWTIGWGNTTIDGRPVHAGDKITQAHADKMRDDWVAANCKSLMAALHRHPSVNQLAAMLSLVYNVGLHAFLHSHCCAAYNRGDINECMRQWNWGEHGSKALPGLIRRRQAERDLFLQTSKSDAV